MQKNVRNRLLNTNAVLPTHEPECTGDGTTGELRSVLIAPPPQPPKYNPKHNFAFAAAHQSDQFVTQSSCFVFKSVLRVTSWHRESFAFCFDGSVCLSQMSVCFVDDCVTLGWGKWSLCGGTPVKCVVFAIELMPRIVQSDELWKCPIVVLRHGTKN